MGGGGGYSLSSKEIEQLRQEVEERTRNSLLEADVNGYLSEQLARINSRDTVAISRYIDAILEAFGDAIEVEKLIFGGSVAKHTHVDGLSDVDSLVVMKDEAASEASPEQLRQQLADALKAKLRFAEVASIEPGIMAVNISYRDGTEIQLLPARERDGHTEISTADGKDWTAIEPRRFAQVLTNVNKRQAGMVVPTIKLAKAIISSLPEDSRLSGYHTEALAVAAFSRYDGTRTAKRMLTHFFQSAAANVMRPIKDVTGQSRHIDEKLGGAESAERRRLARQLSKIGDRMETATSPNLWQNLLSRD